MTYLTYSTASQSFNVDMKKFKKHRNLAAIMFHFRRIMNRMILPNSVISVLALVGFTGMAITYC